MDIFDFEELVSEMLKITDEQRADDDFVFDSFYERFGIELEQGYELACELLQFTPKVQSGLTGDSYHAFVGKTMPFTLKAEE